MSSTPEIEDLRLTVLCLLTDASGYRANQSLLLILLRSWGHVISVDRMRYELSWLAEMGLISVENIGGVMIATLTDRGQDAVIGAAAIPGVRRPAPGSA